MVPIVWRKILKDNLIKIFVGWDSREDLAFQVCKQSILDRAKFPNSIEIASITKSKLFKRNPNSFEVNAYVVFEDVFAKSFTE